MNENMENALKIGIGITIVLVLAALAFLFVGFAKNKANGALDTISGLTENAAQSYTEIDGQTITGASLIAFIENWRDTNEKIQVNVQGSTPGVWCYTDSPTFTTAVPKKNYKFLYQKGQAGYVDKASKYDIVVTWEDDANGTGAALQVTATLHGSASPTP